MIWCVFSIILIVQSIENTKFETWEKWIPPFVRKTDLLCPTDICTIGWTLNVTSKDRCCTCLAKPSWKFNPWIYDLVLKYTRRGGIAQLIGETTCSKFKIGT